MDVLIIGAGAIGGSLGAYLARAGHDVILVDADAAHVRAMQMDGLRIEGREAFTVPVTAITPDALAAALGAREVKTVVLAVKAQHTQTALQPVLAHLARDGFVLSMQNGLNPIAIADMVGGGRTLGACINSMGTDCLDPGRILFGGPGTIRLGELDGRITSRLQALVDVLRTAYVANTEATTNIWGQLWSKEAYGAWLFATALTGEPMADVMDDPANCAMLANLAAEVIRVADAEQVCCDVMDDFVPDAMRFRTPRDWPGIRASLAAMAAMNRRSHKTRSGIWRDLAVRKRRTEIDAQLGIVLERAAAHGIAVPLLKNLVSQIHALEEDRASVTPENLDALRRIDAATYPAG